MERKPNKYVLAAIAVVHVVVVALTWRDIRSRPAEQVRGNKKFWRMVSGPQYSQCGGLLAGRQAPRLAIFRARRGQRLAGARSVGYRWHTHHRICYGWHSHRQAGPLGRG